MRLRLPMTDHHRLFNWDNPLTFLAIAGATLFAVTLVMYVTKVLF